MDKLKADSGIDIVLAKEIDSNRPFKLPSEVRRVSLRSALKLVCHSAGYSNVLIEASSDTVIVDLDLTTAKEEEKSFDIR